MEIKTFSDDFLVRTEFTIYIQYILVLLHVTAAAVVFTYTPVEFRIIILLRTVKILQDVQRKEHIVTARFMCTVYYIINIADLNVLRSFDKK